ncbi:MAG TPA: hypothetical protein PLQ91_07190 [Bacteroidales bacterium]|nr:hypothetical protein [Bacteroidales bacterium]
MKNIIMLYFKILSLEFINFIENFIVMKDLFANTYKYLALPKNHKRDFLNHLYQYLVNNNANAVDYQKVKIQITARNYKKIEILSEKGC